MTVIQRHPIGDMTAEAILDEFVADAAAWQATPLERLIRGLNRVHHLRRLPDIEDAYILLLDRVQATTGLRRLPITR